MRRRVLAKKLHNHRMRLIHGCADRAVATTVILAVAILFLLIGFCGRSLDLRLPHLGGWIYIGIVAALAAGALVWLFRTTRTRHLHHSGSNKHG